LPHDAVVGFDFGKGRKRGARTRQFSSSDVSVAVN
jgi:hypothetical protein